MEAPQQPEHSSTFEAHLMRNEPNPWWASLPGVRSLWWVRRRWF